jgi:putative Mg2+ transporter-C (MgtC) family protein
MVIIMNLFDVSQLYYIARIVVAGICGIFIGLERKNRSKEAGVRTHFVVACASALMMVISKYGFGDIVSETVGGRGADGARLAAQVVSGIGFLGAGMIFVHKNTVTGLTTAAGIWATSGVGLAVGAGMYAVGVVTSALIVIAQILLHKDFRWMKNSKSKKLVVKGVTEAQYQQNLTEQLKKEGITVYDVYIEKDDGGYNYTFIIEIPDDVYEQDIISDIDYNCKLSSNL